LQDFGAAFALIGKAVEFQGFGDLIPYAVQGVKGGRGLLKDHGNFPAPDSGQFLRGKRGKASALKKNFPAQALYCLSRQRGNGKAGEAFAAAGFSHQAQDFTLVNTEANIVHSEEGFIPPPYAYG
jgi:hypothetical protein